MIRKIGLACALFLLVGASDSEAPELPADLQLQLLAKVLSFDRSNALGDEIVIAVLYQREFPASVRARDALLEAARNLAPASGGTPISVVAVAHGDGHVDRLRAAGADVVLIAPLRSVDLRRTAAQVRAAGMRTASGTPTHGRGVAAVSFLVRDGRPRIVIDERLAQQEGAQFSSQLLRVVEVVR